MEHVPVSLNDAHRSLQILIADEPTAGQVAHTFFANPTPVQPNAAPEESPEIREYLLLIVKTGSKLLPPQALVDYSKLVGEYFSKRLAAAAKSWGEDVAPCYFRMENDIQGCHETTSAVSNVPITMPRAMMGLRKLMDWEQKDQKRRRVASVIQRWKHGLKEERNRLIEKYNLTTDDGDEFVFMVGKLGTPPSNQEECQVAMAIIESSISSSEFPPALRHDIEAELYVQVVSASVVAHSHACHYTANHSIQALQDNAASHIRSNYQVEAYTSGARSYRQTALVLVNTPAQLSHVWVPSSETYSFALLSQHLVAPPTNEEASDFTKSQRKVYNVAEGSLAAHTLKLKNRDGKMVASGATCVVTDQFTVELVRHSVLGNIDEGEDEEDGDDDEDDSIANHGVPDTRSSTKSSTMSQASVERSQAKSAKRGSQSTATTAKSAKHTPQVAALTKSAKRKTQESEKQPSPKHPHNK
jgi:hypothetical protein